MRCVFIVTCLSSSRFIIFMELHGLHIPMQAAFAGLSQVLDSIPEVHFIISRLCVVRDPKTDGQPQQAEQRIHQLLSLKKTLELLPMLLGYMEGLEAELLVIHRENLQDPGFATLHQSILDILHPDATLQKGVFDMKVQKCFAVRGGLDGLLDVARRTYSETVEDVQSIRGLTKMHRLVICLISSLSITFAEFLAIVNVDFLALVGQLAEKFQVGHTRTCASIATKVDAYT